MSYEQESVMARGNYIVYASQYVGAPDCEYCQEVDKKLIYKNITEDELNKNLSMLIQRGVHIERIEKFIIEQHYLIDINVALVKNDYDDSIFLI